MYNIGYRETGKNSYYNRAKAKQYIDTYWKNFNPAYPAFPVFEVSGGDCANFISQVLHAGGMEWIDDGNPSHYTWYTNWYCKPGASIRDGDNRVTLSWKVAAAFERHWRERAARFMTMSYADAMSNINNLAYQVRIGDVMQFCYPNGIAWHTLVVTGFAWDAGGGFNDVVLASHTLESNRRSLYHTLEKEAGNNILNIYIIKEGD